MTTQAAHPESTATREVGLSVAGMDCASCVAHVEKAAGSVPGVGSVNVSLARGQAMVQYDPKRASPEQIADAITQIGYPAVPEVHQNANAEEERVAQQAAHARA